jgi:DnaK suppressor protein
LNIAELESDLRLRREKILTIIREHLHLSEDPDELVLANHAKGIEDQAAIDLLNDTDIARISHEFAELQDIDVALKRIKDGTYGLCASCGDSISAERMGAHPTARLCLNCQENIEKRRGNKPGATL